MKAKREKQRTGYNLHCDECGATVAVFASGK